jgi:protein-disulfide isomerase
MKAYPDKIRVVFKHFPLNFHKDAPLAHEASIEANVQGKFWEYHDKLFANQKRLKRPELEKYAQEIGLNMAKFKKALDKRSHKKQCDADIAAGGEIKVRGTPSVFINGRKAPGLDFTQWKKVIDEELKKAEALLKAGTPLKDVYNKLIAKGKVFKMVADEVASFDISKSPIMGDKKAPITIIEFSDFECTYCGRISPTLKKLVDRNPGQVKLVFKNFPLSFHKNAQKAAEAGFAALAQGKFWAMHDIMFQNFRALQVDKLYGYAKQAGLDVAKFKADLTSDKYKAQVRADFNEGRGAKVRGTPSVYINGRKVEGARSVGDYEKAMVKHFGLKKK